MAAGGGDGFVDRCGAGDELQGPARRRRCHDQHGEDSGYVRAVHLTGASSLGEADQAGARSVPEVAGAQNRTVQG